MPVGFGGVNTRGRPLPIVAHLKKIIVQVKSETNCLAHALIIAIVKITNDPSYKSYRQGKKLGPLFHQLLKTVGMNLDQGGDQTTHAISGTFQSIELLFFGFKLWRRTLWCKGQSEKRTFFMMKRDVITTWSQILQVQWQKCVSVKAVKKDVLVTWHTSANSHVPTACPSLRAHSRMFEYRTGRVIGILGFGRVLTSIRKRSCEESSCANKRETVSFGCPLTSKSHECFEK